MTSLDDFRAIAERIAAISAVQIKNAEIFRNTLQNIPTGQTTPDAGKSPSVQPLPPGPEEHRP